MTNDYPKRALESLVPAAAGVAVLALLYPLADYRGWGGELVFVARLCAIACVFGGFAGALIALLASFFQHGDNLRDVRDASKPREF